MGAQFCISIHAPARGRLRCVLLRTHCQNISIHAPREGGDGSLDVIGNKAVISIHAPREGGDVLPKDKADEIALFQSTPPARGATAGHHLTVAAQVISIHAPREGGDDAAH